MLLPTSVDVLRCVERTLQTVIAPTLTGAAERSAAATIGHLLRHVALRIEREGAMLFTEIGTFRPLLSQAASCLEVNFPDDTEATHVRDSIAAVLARPVDSKGYRDVSSLAEEVGALRQSVCDALTFMHRQEAPLTGSMKSVYEAMQRYTGWELEQEAQIIDPAFEGFGPRR
jgi:hypothetical protein